MQNGFSELPEQEAYIVKGDISQVSFDFIGSIKNKGDVKIYCEINDVYYPVKVCYTKREREEFISFKPYDQKEGAYSCGVIVEARQISGKKMVTMEHFLFSKVDGVYFPPFRAKAFLKWTLQFFEEKRGIHIEAIVTSLETDTDTLNDYALKLTANNGNRLKAIQESLIGDMYTNQLPFSLYKLKEVDKFAKDWEFYLDLIFTRTPMAPLKISPSKVFLEYADYVRNAHDEDALEQ